jgi:NADH:ubiquinone oxidoreductase subunit 3 (subunit A)
MFLIPAVFGIAALILGLAMVKTNQHKAWKILILVGVLCLAISAFLFVSTILLIYRDDTHNQSKYPEYDIETKEESISHYWRTCRSYSNTYLPYEYGIGMMDDKQLIFYQEMEYARGMQT